MKPELKDKWIKALRSGVYRQGQTKLVDTSIHGYKLHCCLGVLCEVAGLETTTTFEGYGYKVDEHTTLISELESWWLDEFGITSAQQDNLIKMNDGLDGGREHSFSEIADWIEGNL